MAPTRKDTGGEKDAKLTLEQSTALVLDYLRKQNRPYSATDISANLKNRVTKTAAAKLLKDLHERKEIDGRAAGKQIVYHATQDESETFSAENLQSLATEIASLREATATLKIEERNLITALRQTETTGVVPLADLRHAVAALELEHVALTHRLANLRSGTTKTVSRDEHAHTLREWRVLKKTVDARRVIRRELWAEIKALLPPDAALIEATIEDLGLEL